MQQAWWEEQDAEGSHLELYSQEVEKANWKWCKSLNSQNLHPMTYLLQQDRAF